MERKLWHGAARSAEERGGKNNSPTLFPFSLLGFFFSLFLVCVFRVLSTYLSETVTGLLGRGARVGFAAAEVRNK